MLRPGTAGLCPLPGQDQERQARQRTHGQTRRCRPVYRGTSAPASSAARDWGVLGREGDSGARSRRPALHVPRPLPLRPPPQSPLPPPLPVTASRRGFWKEAHLPSQGQAQGLCLPCGCSGTGGPWLLGGQCLQGPHSLVPPLSGLVATGLSVSLTRVPRDTPAGQGLKQAGPPVAWASASGVRSMETTPHSPRVPSGSSVQCLWVHTSYEPRLGQWAGPRHPATA